MTFYASQTKDSPIPWGEKYATIALDTPFVAHGRAWTHAIRVDDGPFAHRGAGLPYNFLVLDQGASKVERVPVTQPTNEAQREAKARADEYNASCGFMPSDHYIAVSGYTYVLVERAEALMAWRDAKDSQWSSFKRIMEGYCPKDNA